MGLSAFVKEVPFRGQKFDIARDNGGGKSTVNTSSGQYIRADMFQ
jgi:hypothetical protein